MERTILGSPALSRIRCGHYGNVNPLMHEAAARSWLFRYRGFLMTSRAVLTEALGRLAERRLDGLHDEPRYGAPCAIDDYQIAVPICSARNWTQGPSFSHSRTRCFNAVYQLVICSARPVRSPGDQLVDLFLDSLRKCAPPTAAQR